MLLWLLQFMQEQGISLDEVDQNGNTAVHVAAQHGHLSCLQVLHHLSLSLLYIHTDVTAVPSLVLSGTRRETQTGNSSLRQEVTLAPVSCCCSEGVGSLLLVQRG